MPTTRNFIRTTTVLAVVTALTLTGCATGDAPTPEAASTFAPGEMTIYAYGQPQYRQQFIDTWLESNQDIASGVSVETVQTEGEADARQRLMTSLAAGAYDEAPDVIQTGAVNMADMAESGILVDLTEFMDGIEDELVPGAAAGVTYNGSVYGLPDGVRPQMLFYNQEIFDEYGIDPKRMDTFEGYIEVGRELKELSNGEVMLSYVDPGSLTWRYWGRRGLMPQADAQIWNDKGEVVIDTDPGALLAFTTLETLYEEGLLLKSQIMQAPLYEATREGKVATYYIGAFWDEFLRGNVADMAGDWRAMPAPMFEEVGTRGAPVVGMFSLVKKPDSNYDQLFREIWTDFEFDAEARIDWTKSMVEQNAPFTNPIVKENLNDPFWSEPSDFYGGQSFRATETEALTDGATNMRVTKHDAEADVLISNELEKWLAGSQTMQQAIANMGESIRSKIGTTTPAK